MPYPDAHARMHPLEPRLLLAAIPIADLEAGEDRHLSNSMQPMAAASDGMYFVLNRDGIAPELWKSTGTPGGTTRVAYLPRHTDILHFATAGTRAYLLLSSNEFWTSDGTAAGTRMLKLFNRISTDRPAHSAVFDGRFYFTVPGSSTDALWTTDGTVAGTQYVTSLNVRGMAARHDGLYITTANGLWKSDGTAAGTTLLKPLDDAAQPVFVNDTLFFTGTDAATGTELWTSDGTSAGTRLVADLTPGPSSSSLGRLTSFKDRLFFVSGFGTRATLWSSDGTPDGTSPFTDITPLSENLLSANPLVTLGDHLIFAGDRDDVGAELWKTDGTEAGTTLIRDIVSGRSNSHPSNLVFSGDAVYFVAWTPDHGWEVWRTDGTESGTVLAADIYPGPSSSYPRQLESSGDHVFFQSIHPAAGDSLLSVGPAAGAALIADLDRWVLSPDVEVEVTDDGTIYFTAGELSRLGEELYKTDGSPGAATLVRDIYLGGASSSPRHLTAIGNTLYFSANTFLHGVELWKSDGTAAGTTLVKDIASLFSSSSPSGLANLNGTLIFAANAGSGFDIWKSNGTADGTVPLPGTVTIFGELQTATVIDGRYYYHTSLSGTLGSANPSVAGDIASGVWDFQRIGDTLYLAIYSSNEVELYKSVQGGQPTLVKDIHPGSGSSASASPSQFAAFQNLLFFSAYDGTHGIELWKSDGTETGTVLVKDIRPGSPGLFSPGSRPMYLTELNGKLLFSADDGEHGAELWITDGTGPGTVLLKDINPGRSSSTPGFSSGFFRFGDRLVFAADDGAHGRELWVTDGTRDGTFRITDANPGAGSTHPKNLTAAGGSLYFTGNDGQAPRLFKLVGPQLSLPQSHFVSPDWQVTLDAVGTAGSEEATAFEWDLDDDGIFGETGPSAARGDEVGQTVTFSSAGLSNGPFTVSVRATDSLGLVTTATTTVTVGPPPGFAPDGGARYHLIGADNAPLLTLTHGHATMAPGIGDAFAGLAIDLSDGATMTMQPSLDEALRLRALSLAETAAFDLFDNDLILAAPAHDRDLLLAALKRHINERRLWTSAPTTHAGLALFDAMPDDSSILIRHTYTGDANGDDRIDADDYFRIDSGFLEQPANPSYRDGDFNYDNTINADDYFLIDSAFLGQSALRAALSAGTSAPPRASLAAENDIFASDRRRTTRRPRPTRLIA